MANDDILGGLDDIFKDDLDTEDVATKESSTKSAPKNSSSEVPEADNIPGQLAVDIYETDDKLIVKSRTAGVKKQDLKINISDGILTIHGNIPNTEEIDSIKPWAQECYWGEFSREITLPVPVVENDVEAILRDGVLTITFTKVANKPGIDIQVL